MGVSIARLRTYYYGPFVVVTPWKKEIKSIHRMHPREIYDVLWASFMSCLTIAVIRISLDSVESVIRISRYAL